MIDHAMTIEKRISGALTTYNEDRFGEGINMQDKTGTTNTPDMPCANRSPPGKNETLEDS